MSGSVGHTYLSRSLGELKVLAAYGRAARGAAKDEALLKGSAELAKLKPVFQNARQEAQRLQQQESIEKWREFWRLIDFFR